MVGWTKIHRYSHLQGKIEYRSEKLQEPIKKLSSTGKEGGQVATALLDLKHTVQDLDPSNLDFSEPGWATRMLGKLPFIGSPIQAYFEKFEASQTVIDAIFVSLEKGKEQLELDNEILAEDKVSMLEATEKLKKSIQIAETTKKAFQKKIRTLSDEEQIRFIEEEVIFPLGQRVMDLQQSLAVNQQGAIACELLIRNNKELIKGVARANHVTKSALTTAVTVALALNEQKIVLDKLEAAMKLRGLFPG